MKKILKKFHRGQKGFTLIELLVVIAIIAVLAAIIVPNIGEYISRGTTAAEQSELALVENAVAAAMSGAAVGSLTAGGVTPPGTITSAGGFSLTGPGGTYTVAQYFAGGSLAEIQESYSVADDGTVTQTLLP
jgi:prepilin-type N-terminal cleavage/methylation domain-containing protein